jgi:predicted nucleic acid-binding protein
VSRYVVDASVAAKWYIPEVESEGALRFLDGNHEVLGPELLLPEFGNILWKKVLRRELTPGEAREVLRAFLSAPVAIQSSETLLEPALDLAIGLRRTVYDSLYLALALLRGCRLVTADRPLYDAISQSPFAAHIHWVADPPL